MTPNLLTAMTYNFKFNIQDSKEDENELKTGKYRLVQQHLLMHGWLNLTGHIELCQEYHVRRPVAISFRRSFTTLK